VWIRNDAARAIDNCEPSLIALPPAELAALIRN
jgi:hypothetical protein